MLMVGGHESKCAVRVERDSEMFFAFIGVFFLPTNCIDFGLIYDSNGTGKVRGK